MRALVTGATGFIGRHLVERLLARDHEAICLVRPTSRTGELDRLGAALRQGDMTDADSLARAVEGVDVVFHLAAILKAPWRQAFVDDNLAGAANVADACAARETPPTLIGVSSLAATGPSRDASRPRSEADAPRPVSRYGRMKLACDELVAERAGRLPVTIVRPPMVFGEGDWTVLKLLRTVARGWHIVPTWRSHRLSMIHAADLADGLIEAALHGERIDGQGADPDMGTGVYFTAYDLQPAYAELGRLVARALGGERVRLLRLPGWITGVVAAMSELGGRLRDRPTFLNLDKWREATSGSWVCQVDKARRDLGLATDADVVARFARTAAWFRERGHLPAATGRLTVGAE